ncbi:acetylornithine transaminase [Ruicaihuangia caeni]|uniref:Acetylornithine aminotransferase n=1 Tax=Ruicaihuangia caeni TaxID=3042517 RepID=A0AAW6TCL1_9MICO|nr:acetylornithine transaminase [Klugiella sp. YN-L-19]MDI2099760.1 acetylornithine transaminase [Klugiella sp. YN-L-19]
MTENAGQTSITNDADAAETTPLEQTRRRYTDVMMGSAPPPLRKLVRGEGCHVWDADGNRYLDFLSGIAVNALGHAHPVLVEAISKQAAAVAHISNYFASEPQLALAERLQRLTGAGAQGRVYFGNSGAEANEAAIKLARRHRPEGTLVALHNGFHGRTVGALSITGKPMLREPFEPLLPGVEHIEPTVMALESAFDAKQPVSAVFLEPIQGEAGVVPLSDEFVQAARRLTTEHGALLIVDEIQTGAGRTGDWFAYQHHGIVPDVVTLAKGIGGGVPIGAMVTFGEASELFKVGQHGSTFGGNPLATAVGDAVLAEIERAGLVENARRRGEQLREAVLGIQHPMVSEVRGRGLLLGVALAAPHATAVANRALELGLIVNAANDTSVRLAPPLIVGDAELEEFTRLFTRALEAAA